MIISGVTISNITITDITPYLYVFSNFTFTNGNIVGRVSGNTAQFLANYSNVGNTWITDSNYYRVTTPGYQVWTVPQTATYEIEAAGSRSGLNTYAGNTFGYGAIVRGRFSLNRGTNITIAVGSFSANTTNNGAYSGAGGGGGTFVVVTDTGNPLIIGGGGGGSGRYTSSQDSNSSTKLGVNGTTTTYGTSSRNAPFGNAAPGGINGLGGNSHIAANGVTSLNSYDGGAGGGLLGNGASGANNNNRPGVTAASSGQGGSGFLANLLGGNVASTYTTQGSNGGFGGAGGGTPIAGGGGGGYSGGGGSYASASTVSDGGGGGGSYIDSNATSVATSDGLYNTSATFGGASIANIGTFNANAGYVKITKL